MFVSFFVSFFVSLFLCFFVSSFLRFFFSLFLSSSLSFGLSFVHKRRLCVGTYFNNFRKASTLTVQRWHSRVRRRCQPNNPKCSNEQMFECQIHNCQMLKCTNAQIHLPIAQTLKCQTQMLKCPNAQMPKCSNTQMLVCKPQMLKCQSHPRVIVVSVACFLVCTDIEQSRREIQRHPEAWKRKTVCGEVNAIDQVCLAVRKFLQMQTA